MRALTTDVVIWLAQGSVGAVGCHAGDKERNTSTSQSAKNTHPHLLLIKQQVLIVSVVIF